MPDNYCVKFKGGKCEKRREYVPRSYCYDMCELSKRQKLPPLAAQAASLTKETVKYIKAGRPQRSPELIARLQKICEPCEFYNAKTVRCSKCGCFLTVKGRWATARCDLGKWDKTLEEELPLLGVFIDEKEQYQEHPAAGVKIFKRRNKKPMNMVDMYHGASVFLISNGPSLSKLDWSMFKQPGILTFGLNNGAHTFRPDFVSLQDSSHKFMESIWEDPKMIKFTNLGNGRHIYEKGGKAGGKKVETCPGVVYHQRCSDFKAEEWLTKDCICWGLRGNRISLTAMLHISYFLGFRRIFLVGVDWHMATDYAYFFQQERDDKAVKHNMGLYRKHVPVLEAVRDVLADVGVYVYNCNPDSHLKVFPHVPLATAITSARINMSQSTEGRYGQSKFS
jgi:hypothetical protein